MIGIGPISSNKCTPSATPNLVQNPTPMTGGGAEFQSRIGFGGSTILSGTSDTTGGKQGWEYLLAQRKTEHLMRSNNKSNRFSRIGQLSSLQQEAVFLGKPNVALNCDADS